jgi:hypothetical protein
MTIPNTFFHIAMAYAILRCSRAGAAGVALYAVVCSTSRKPASKINNGAHTVGQGKAAAASTRHDPLPVVIGAACG